MFAFDWQYKRLVDNVKWLNKKTGQHRHHRLRDQIVSCLRVNAAMVFFHIDMITTVFPI